MDTTMRVRIRGCVVGAAVGDALGCRWSLARGSRRSGWCGRCVPAGAVGSFTDDTEMALASPRACWPTTPWTRRTWPSAFWPGIARAADVGIQCGRVLERIDGGQDWQAAVKAVERQTPDAAGNGSVMRCCRSPWPLERRARLLVDSRLQSRVTHPHADCQAGVPLRARRSTTCCMGPGRRGGDARHTGVGAGMAASSGKSSRQRRAGAGRS